MRNSVAHNFLGQTLKTYSKVIPPQVAHAQTHADKMPKCLNFPKNLQLFPVKLSYDETRVKMDLFSWKLLLWVFIREQNT